MPDSYVSGFFVSLSELSRIIENALKRNKMSELSRRIENALDENSALLDIAETPSIIANDANLLNKAMINHNRIMEIINTDENLPDPTPEGVCKL